MEMTEDNVFFNPTFKLENQVNTGGTSAEEEGVDKEVYCGNPDLRDTAAVIPSTGQDAGTVTHTHTRQEAGTVHIHTRQEVGNLL